MEPQVEPLLAAAPHRPPATEQAKAARNPTPFTRVAYADVQRALRKALRGERLTFDDGVNLYHAPDLVELGAVADEVNRSKNGRDVYFNVNRHINPTNVCALSCKFCAFSRKPGEPGSYAYTDDELATRAQAAAASGATEIHMVGGLHPRWNLKNYQNIIRVVKENAPEAHIKAFTAVELDWLSRRERKTVAEILEALKEAGLASLPGGGAEIFAPYVRDLICDTKLSAEGWIDIHRTAHRLGLRSNCTMLYGHIEDVESRVDHVLRLRALQDETEGFQVFIPLAFQPENNDLGITKHTYGVDDLKTIAVSRLMLDNFRNVKAYWIMMGDRMAQSALHFGANDVDGTVVEEKIANMAGSRSGMAFAKSRLLRLIRSADRIPVERSTTYQPLRRYENPQEDDIPHDDGKEGTP
ncbi:MAG: aminofutalosine synthase MqnE [Silvanigrellales bacterium]|nr:aminofutalosine synthase MqnE [Silvanigrellales bacterium]